MANIGGYSVPVIHQQITYTPKPKKHYGKFFRFVGSICMLFVVLLLIINVFKIMQGGSNVSFTGFLNWLSTVKPFQIVIDISAYGVDGNWGIFDFLRGFFDVLSKLTGVAAWLGANMLNFIIFAGYFLRFLLS